jgi:hypothetical protein
LQRNKPGLVALYPGIQLRNRRSAKAEGSRGRAVAVLENAVAAVEVVRTRGVFWLFKQLELNQRCCSARPDPNRDPNRDPAREGGARILDPPADYPYGERQYTAEDLSGHRWTFSQSIADVVPEEWGGTSRGIE